MFISHSLLSIWNRVDDLGNRSCSQSPWIPFRVLKSFPTGFGTILQSNWKKTLFRFPGWKLSLLYFVERPSGSWTYSLHIFRNSKFSENIFLVLMNNITQQQLPQHGNHSEIIQIFQKTFKKNHNNAYTVSRSNSWLHIYFQDECAYS